MSVFLHQTTTRSTHSTYSSTLYMSVFLHQTTTGRRRRRHPNGLYMSVFLHQTTTIAGRHRLNDGCICLFSYIKPQLGRRLLAVVTVVYVCFPTSNHNSSPSSLFRTRVVYVCFPTSNHNMKRRTISNIRLYMSVFLHQTTTFLTL